MIDALYSGISGLDSFQKGLNTESNNIANVNTVAYKSDNISFADLMYQSGSGMGTKIDTIDKDFTQGNMKITNNALDMAINGKGFFIVKGDTNEVNFTRSGDFRMASDGTLRLPNGYQVQGLPSTIDSTLSTDDTKIFTSAYSNFLASQTVISTDGKIIETINSKSTDYELTAVNDLISQKGDNYKSRASKISDIDALRTAYSEALKNYSSSNDTDSVTATSQNTKITFNQNLITDSLNSLELFVDGNIYRSSFDTDAITTIKNLADQISDIDLLSASVDANGVLSIDSMLPGKNVLISDAKVLDGAIITTPLPGIDTMAAVLGSGKAKLEAIELALKGALEDSNAKFLKISNVINSNDLATTSIGELQLKLDTLAISDNSFGEPEIDNGVLYLSQGDNRFVVGQVATALFTNEYGLTPSGDNLFALSSETKDFVFATTENTILSNTLELSNSELSESLVSLMVFQRAFEASSKSITTSDDFLKTAIQLKK